MLVNPLVVKELQTLFKTGATPSALIRHIADGHADEPELDGLVRAYFREGFHVPMIRVGAEQVKHIARGGNLPILNLTVLHQMIQARQEWDTPEATNGHSPECWLDETAVTDAALLAATVDPNAIPELANSWNRMDEEAKQFIRRTVSSARSLHEKANALAVLAERLQQQVTATVARSDQGV